jgi:UDP-N-acetylmuramate dehydrogenase
MKISAEKLGEVPGLRVERDAPLSEYTRFGLGGPAAILADATTEQAFAAALRITCETGGPCVVIGGGSNLVVSDAGFDGVVLRFTGNRIAEVEDGLVMAEAGADLQALVDFTIDHGLAGIHTMTGVPGWVGGAVYGNAGAYGRSLHESVVRVRFFDGAGVRYFSNAGCGFRYRHSTFKDHKQWTVFATELQLARGDEAELRRCADDILNIRNAKYPPTMKCAGSIFKNLILAELPESVQRQVDPKVVREGKVPSAWFLEQVGAKGIRSGGIQVAEYHANLIYNAGGGTAAEVREIVDDLKHRVRDRFGFEIEEEVQYVGF